MSQRSFERFQRPRIEPYWYPILLLALAGAVLFLYHLATGIIPDRVVLEIPALGFDIYWYGIIITTGIILGGYVVSRLARERAVAVLEAHVPPDVRAEPVTALNLPKELAQILSRRKIATLGELLLRWGFGKEDLGLNDAGMEALREHLEERPEVHEVWLQRPPWGQWNPVHVWNGLIWCLILAVIGARLYHVLTPSPSMAEVGIESPLDYFRHPLQLINLRRGGLGIYGGIAGGALGLLIYAYRARISALAWADLAVVGVALGQAIGRWGNYFNQELYGRPTNVPWAITITPAHRLSAYTEFSRFHPAFLYESLWNFLVFLLLLTLLRRYKKQLKTGDLMGIYLISYAVGRILLETVRLDSATLIVGGVDLRLPVATVVSIVVAVLMAGWIFRRHRTAPR